MPRPQTSTAQQLSSKQPVIQLTQPLSAPKHHKSPHLAPTTVPSTSDSDLFRFLEQNEQNENIDDEISQIKANIVKVNEDFGEKRETLRNYIDEVLPYLHGQQRRKALENLKSSQLEEVQKL